MPPARSPKGARRDRELEAGTSAHYEDPTYYDRTYAGRTADVALYVERCAARGGEVLEYGCGSGRITLPLARAGLDVTGLDLSAPMLAALRRSLAVEPPEVRARVRTSRGDMRFRRLGRRFRTVICPFNALLHLYDWRDLVRFLERARGHLEPRAGRLIFDVSVPDPSELARDPNKPHGVPPFLYPTEHGDVRVRYRERFDYDGARQVLFVSMEFEPMAGGEAWMTPLAHRQYYPEELDALLHFGGFEIEERLGGFEGEPWDRDARTLVVVARARGRAR